MKPSQHARLISGFLISPLVLPLLVYITYLFVFGVQNYNSEATLTSTKTIIWMNYLLVLGVGIPAYYILQFKRWESLRNYALGGLALGLILILFISHSFVYLFCIVFSFAGVLEGVLFWYIVLYQPAPVRKHSKRGRRPRRRYR